MSPSAEPRTATGRAPHRRNEQARLAVLHAADDLLVEKGFGGVTVEGIAARAGVAKQTIYRWWPSKSDILLDTLVEDAGRALAMPQDGTTVERMARHLKDLARFLTRDPAGRVLLALIGEAQHDETAAARLRERFSLPQRREQQALLRHGVELDEAPSDLNVDEAIDALVGPVVYRALMGRPVSGPFVERLVADILRRPVR